MTNPTEMLHDVTFIQDMKHIACGPWQQYDVLLAAQGYGWEMMLQWADYMASADLENISQVTAGALGAGETEYTAAYSTHGSCAATPELKQERGVLSIAGTSRVLCAPVKIVWVNQTRMLRLFTLVDDDALMRRYIETVIRRTFGTPDGMKLGQPIPGSTSQSTAQGLPRVCEEMHRTKAPMTRKNVLGTIGAGLVMLFGFCMMMLGIVEVTETVPEASAVAQNAIDDGEVYYFDEITVIDSLYNIYAAYREDWMSDILTHTGTYTDVYTVNASDSSTYLVSYVDGDGNTVYTIIKFEGYAELEERCAEYANGLEEGTATQGDLVISGCFHGWGMSDSWYMSPAVKWLLEQEGGQDNLKNWMFYYDDAETIADYRRAKAEQNAIPFIVGLGLFGLGLFWMIRIQIKRKRILSPVPVVLPPEEPVPTESAAPAVTGPAVRFEGTCVYVDSAAFFRDGGVDVNGILPLTEKEPTITLYEDGLPTRRYRLQTEGDEDFTGKHFLINVRLHVIGTPPVPVAQIDGFISDTAEARSMTSADVGYRFQGHYLACGGEVTRQYLLRNTGQDLVQRALKYPGYTNPANVRLVGVCDACGESFCFHGYAQYMVQEDVAYSNDGQDACSVSVYEIEDKENWSCGIEGKVYRYYNSFCCPHCHSPYIDYKRHPENKVFGASACVHLGHQLYRPSK